MSFTLVFNSSQAATTITAYNNTFTFSTTDSSGNRLYPITTSVTITTLDRASLQSYVTTLVGLLNIPTTVTSIADFAFNNGNTALKTVTFSSPATITRIGDYGFSGVGITSIIIPGTVTSMNYAFAGCASLTTAVISPGVTSTSLTLFQGCTVLTSVTIPNTVIDINNSFVNQCPALTTINIPSSVRTIGNFAFSGGSSASRTPLTSITIPNTVTSIANNAFIFIGDSATVITSPLNSSNYVWNYFSNSANLTAGQVINFALPPQTPTITVNNQTVSWSLINNTVTITSTVSNSPGAMTYYLSTSFGTTTANANITNTFNTNVKTTIIGGNRWVGVGGFTNAIAYSDNGITWTGLGNTIFSSAGYGVAWNGTRWVAVGSGTTHTIAYSDNGLIWTGLGKSIFSSDGRGVAWNGTRWVALGSGGNSIAYSDNALTWTGLGTTIFTSQGWVATWNGTRWVAGGEGTNALAYSDNGLVWTGLGTSIFSDRGYGVAWNGTRWVAGGKGTTNSLAYSNDGITWTGLGLSIFQSWGGFGVAYNGTRWVAGGLGTNTLAYSNDGLVWTGLGVTIFSSEVNGVAYNGTRWVALGSGINALAYSDNGLIWTGVTNVIGTYGKNAAWNADNQTIREGTVSINGPGTINVYVTQSAYGNSFGAITTTTLAGTINVLSIPDIRPAATQTVSYPATTSATVTATSNNPTALTYLLDTPSNTSVAVGKGTNSIAYSNDGITWTGLGETIFSNYGLGVAWNGTRWVAVGNGGNSIAYSNDGLIWTGLGSTILSWGYGVAYNGSRWVAVGEGTNLIAYSNDGLIWTGVTGTNIFTTAGNGVAWNGTRWVAVGNGTTHTLAYSNDGITWTGIGKTIFTSAGYIAAWNGTMWVAGGVGTNSIAYSNDGITWTGLGNSIFSSNGQGVAWNGTRWVAVGSGTNSIAYSNDGLIWTGVTGTTIFSTNGCSVTWNGLRWIAGGKGTNTIAYSNDGLTWTGLGITIISSEGRGAAWNSFKNSVSNTVSAVSFNVAVGTAGSGNSTIAYSSDGITWTGLGTSIFGTYGRGVAGNGTRWVAVGNGTSSIAYSNNGITWTSSTNIFSSGLGIAWNGTLWVAVGLGANSIAYSNNGLIWTGVTLKTIFSSYGYGVAGNGTRWVAVGQGTTHTIAYSNDGLIWTGVTGSTSIFGNYGLGVAWNTTMWVAVGSGTTHTIAYSNDGITWTGIGKTIFTSAGYIAAWNGTRWVAVGSGGNSIAYSNDGLIWTGVTGTTIFSSGGRGVAWNGTRWVAVGNGTNSIAYSNDGLTWTSVTGSTSIFGPYGRGVASKQYNVYNGNVTIGGVGTINVLATQAASGNFAAITTPLTAGTINVLGAPTITPAVTQTIAYRQVNKVTVNATSTSSGAFTYSLQTNTTTFSGFATIVPSTGEVTLGGIGTINVFVTQAATNVYSAVTTPVPAGTITVNYIAIPCFKEDTQILTVDGYRFIQDLRKGDLVKTLKHGYVPINTIGNQSIYNEKDKMIFDKVYKCTNENYPEIFEDLYITGLHAVLVDGLTDEQQSNIKGIYNDSVYITDDKYRLPVCYDERATLYETETAEKISIYHLALDHEDENLNYGIYANGLLVETTSIRLMAESGLIMIE